MSTPKRVLRAITERDGHECIWHGESCGTDVLVPQHRQGGMGGSKSKHRLSNVVWLCSSMNGLIETDAELAREARKRGIKISFADDSEAKPVVDSYGDKWWIYDDGSKSGQPF